MSVVESRVEKGDAELLAAARATSVAATSSYALVALAHYVAAAVLREDPVEALPEPTWCRVELFGHTVRYGRVEEVVFAGRRFVEIVEPEIANPAAPADPDADPVEAFCEPPSFPEHRRRYHPNAIYGLEEIGEEAVMDVLRRQRGLDLPVSVRHAEDDGDEADLF